MFITQTKPLFAWDCLEDSPSLKTIRELLSTLPDAPLLESLRSARGKGRNDYPVGSKYSADQQSAVSEDVAARRKV